MNDLMMVLLVLAGGFAFVGGVAYLLQRQAMTQGSLFTQPASPLLRILALLLGLLFAGFFVLELVYSESVHVIMPVLAIALIAYSLGADRFLKHVQEDEDQHER